MKKIDTDELNDLLIVTENAQRIRSYSADDYTRTIADEVLQHVRKRVKHITKAKTKKGGKK